MGKTPEALLEKIRKLSHNKKCVNCGTENPRGFGDVCFKFKTFVCYKCKSSHASFSHLCKSVAMSNWTMHEVTALSDEEGGGNLNCRRTWLGKLQSLELRPDDDIKKVKEFINICYNQQKYYVEPQRIVPGGIDDIDGDDDFNNEAKVTPSSIGSFGEDSKSFTESKTSLSTPLPLPQKRVYGHHNKVSAPSISISSKPKEKTCVDPSRKPPLPPTSILDENQDLLDFGDDEISDRNMKNDVFDVDSFDPFQTAFPTTAVNSNITNGSQSQQNTNSSFDFMNLNIEKPTSEKSETMQSNISSFDFISNGAPSNNNLNNSTASNVTLPNNVMNSTKVNSPTEFGTFTSAPTAFQPSQPSSAMKSNNTTPSFNLYDFSDLKDIEYNVKNNSGKTHDYNKEQEEKTFSVLDNLVPELSLQKQKTDINKDPGNISVPLSTIRVPRKMVDVSVGEQANHAMVNNANLTINMNLGMAMNSTGAPLNSFQQGSFNNTSNSNDPFASLTGINSNTKYPQINMQPAMVQQQQQQQSNSMGFGTTTQGFPQMGGGQFQTPVNMQRQAFVPANQIPYGPGMQAPLGNTAENMGTYTNFIPDPTNDFNSTQSNKNQADPFSGINMF